MDINGKPISKWEKDREIKIAAHRASACEKCHGSGMLWHIKEEYFTPADFSVQHGKPEEINCHFCDGTGYAASSEQDQRQDTT